MESNLALWVTRLVLTLTFIATANLGGYVIVRDPKNKVNRLFGLHVLVALGWMFSSLVHAWDPNHLIHSPRFGNSLGGFSGTLIIPVFAHFALHFPRPLRPVRLWHLGLIYVPATTFALAWPAGMMVSSYQQLPNGQFEGPPTLLFSFYVVWIVLTIPAALAILVWKQRKLTSALERQQIKYILIGFAVTATLCVLGAVVLPYFQIIALGLISPAFFLISVGFTAYAVAHFRLFESAMERVRMIPVVHKVRLYAGLVIGTISFSLEFPLILYLVQSGTSGLWWKIVLVILGGRVLQGLLMSLALRRIIAAPLNRLTASSARIAEGDLGERVNIHPHAPDPCALQGPRDEMDVLAETFNRMAESLEENIQELRGLNAELFKASRFSENIINSVSLALAVVDLDGRVMEWNQAYVEWTGISREEALGRHYIEDLCPGLLDAGAGEIVEELVRTEETVVRQNLTCTLPNCPEECTANVIVFPLKGIEGEVYGAVIVIEDVTERVRLERQLAQSAKLASVGQLAAGIAHEVNNPLGSISSLAQFLLDSTEDAESRETLRTIVAQVTRISGILGDLVNFSRPRAARKQPLDVASVIETVCRLASFNKKFRRIEIVREIDPTALQITADGDQVQQLFLNLLLNAADAMPEGGEVAISTEPVSYGEDERFLRITVADTGEGISEEDLDRIFDPFFTTKPTGQGTGLGLSVCYGIVHAHGGRIDVESERGIGTRFTLDLPRARAEIEEAVDA